MRKPGISSKLPIILFIFSLTFIAFIHGYATRAKQIFPYYLLVKANFFRHNVMLQIRGKKRWFYPRTEYKKPVTIYNKEAINPGLTMISCLENDSHLAVKVIDKNGELIHKWDINWFKDWPKDSTDHIPDSILPQSQPGTHIHGVLILENGDLLYNFENLGLMRVDICGNTIWRLPCHPHHSIFKDEQDILWIPGNRFHSQKLESYPYMVPPFTEAMLYKISLDGELLEEISVFDLLKQNGLEALLLSSTVHNTEPQVTGDLLHLNDIEIFPSTLPQGFFKTGDLMLSLRNLNAILVFDQNNFKLKYKTIGKYARQHDPDFIDGNTISVYDNNNYSIHHDEKISSIYLESAVHRSEKLFFQGSDSVPFYSATLGKHQWLDNGNLLITEARTGRAFEIDEQGNLVWEYVNILDKDFAGILFEAKRLPILYTRELFDSLNQNCK